MSYPREEEEEEELPQQVADLAQATVPSALRGIRSCKRCGILKTLDQFINEGCENCPFLDMVSQEAKAVRASLWFW
jgi:transcription elongation factor SPT4